MKLDVDRDTIVFTLSVSISIIVAFMMMTFLPNKTTVFNIEPPKDISKRQALLFTMANVIAKRDGHETPYLLHDIILQKRTLQNVQWPSNVAGNEINHNDHYYGVAQLKLSTAKDVLQRYPALWEEFNFQTHTDAEIITKLIENDCFNLAVASKYILIQRNQRNFNNGNRVIQMRNLNQQTQKISIP